MAWKDINKYSRFWGQGDPQQENKILFYVLLFVLGGTLLYLLSFYFKTPAA